MPVLADKNNCTGCSACMSGCPKKCITMQRDENGFFFPEINLKECIDCHKCEKICPVLNQEKSLNTTIAYAAYSKDDKIRMESSSGGIFSEIAKRVLQKGGVVYGSSYGENCEVYHCCIEKIEDLYKIRGAKYAESRLGNSFLDIFKRLKDKQIVLFSGTPCQVEGLKAFLGKEYDNLICIDFVCHGVPSPMAWDKYIEFRKNQDGEEKNPVKINLRDKSTGWSRYSYSNVFTYEDHIEYSCRNSDSLFMKLFVGDYISRKSCSNCQFKGYSRVSDITLGDFWGIWDIDPDMDDNKGTSVVLIQSSKGRELWEQLKDSIICKEMSLEQASRQNQSMVSASVSKPDRDIVLNQIRNGKIELCEKLFEQKKISVITRIRNKGSRLLHSILDGKKDINGQ